MDELAKQVIAVDRKRFRVYYEATLNFLRSQNNVFVAGDVACEAFHTKQIDVDSVAMRAQPIIVWTQDPYETALALLQHLWQSVSTETSYHVELFIQPSVPGSVYNVQVPARQFASIRGLGEYRDKPLSDLIRPPNIDGIKLISPEVLLIDLYQRVFSSDDEERPELLKLEERLYGRFINDARQGALIEGGGSDDWRIDAHAPLVAALRSDIIALFKAKTLKGPTMIIGQQAVLPDKAHSFLQLLSADEDAEIKNRLTGAFDSWYDSLKKRADQRKIDLPKISVNIMYYWLSLPGEKLLKRFRMFIEQGKNRVQVVDVFNAAQFSICAAHQYTVMRFALIDIWSLLLIQAIGEIDQTSMERQIDRLVQILKLARKAATPIDALKDSDFFGQFVDEKVLARRTRKIGKTDAPSKTVYAAVEFAAKKSKLEEVVA